MYSLTIECPAAEADWRAAEFWEAGCAGVQEDDLPGGLVRLKAFFDAQPNLPGLLAIETPVDWEARTRDSWPAREIGTRLYLAPVWDTSPTPSGRVRLSFNPGMALGTGEHPATDLSLQALDRTVSPGDSVLDLGCGSGILAGAAQALGARTVIGCDIEFQAAQIAAEQYAIPCFQGSLRSARDQSVDLIVANLNAAAIETLRTELSRVARRRLILSGFREAEADLVCRPLATQGFQVVDRLSKDFWVCLLLSNDELSSAF